MLVFQTKPQDLHSAVAMHFTSLHVADFYPEIIHVDNGVSVRIFVVSHCSRLSEIQCWPLLSGHS